MSTSLDANLADTPLEVGQEYASFWNRFGAFFIDFLVLMPLAGLSIYNMISLKAIWLLFLISIVQLLYKPLLESEYGATLGKMALKLKVVTGTGAKMNLGESFLRNVLSIIPALVQAAFGFMLLQDPDFLATETWMEMSTYTQQNQPTWVNFVGIPYIISCFFVPFSASLQALHDRFVPTWVVQPQRI